MEQAPPYTYIGYKLKPDPVDHHSDGDTLDNEDQSLLETSGQPTHIRRRHPRRFHRLTRSIFRQIIPSSGDTINFSQRR
jgi:hypothetical protein